MPIRISIDSRAVRQKLAGFERQIPFVQAAAVNDLAFQVQRAENDAMKTVFHRPRPFSQKATAVRKATKASPTATVYLKDAQARYLAPYENGGLHVTPGKALLEPIDARLDQYGQLPNGAVKRLAARPDVFVATINGVAGFWQRLKRRHIRLLIRFGVNKPVKQHLDFNKRAVALVTRQAPSAIAAAVARAIATARR